MMIWLELRSELFKVDSVKRPILRFVQVVSPKKKWPAEGVTSGLDSSHRNNSTPSSAYRETEVPQFCLWYWVLTQYRKNCVITNRMYPKKRRETLSFSKWCFYWSSHFVPLNNKSVFYIYFIYFFALLSIWREIKRILHLKQEMKVNPWSREEEKRSRRSSLVRQLSLVNIHLLK